MIQKITVDDILEAEKMTAAVKRLHEKRNRLGELIDKLVLGNPPGPKRWRAAVNLWLSLEDMYISPGFASAVEENMAVVKDNASKRQQLLNKWGKSADLNSDMRQTLNMPVGANMFIKIVDPQYASKENMPKLMKEFKEYTIAEKF